MKVCSMCVASLVLSAGIAGGVTLLATTPTPAIAEVATDGAYKIDPVHSSVIFGVRHNGVANFYGRFNKATGEFNIDPADPSKSSINITIDTDSVDTANAGRDKHLKSGDFFSAAEFPTMTFKSKSFKKASEGTYEVTGDLTIRGKTKEITATVSDTGRGKGMRGGEVAGFETKLGIKRSDFGVSFMVGPGLSDDVSILVSAEGGKGG